MGMWKYFCAMLFIGFAAASLPALTPADLDSAQRVDFRRVVAQAKDRVFPAVVFIKCVIQTHDEGDQKTRDVSGSGVIISPEGHVLTNWHVVDKATEIRCQLLDGRALRAKCLGSDKDVDLAVLKLELPADAQPLPCATLGQSNSLQEGEFVMAMGAPWGMSRSVSIGIISCTRRFIPEKSEYSLWLQTDASICPGNSGGPLVNTAGEVIGINALGSMMGGDMGFAIPADTIRALWPQLRDHGAAQWSWLGLQLQPIRDFGRNTYFDGTDGVLVADTDADSPARSAGIQPRDRILSINGILLNALYEEDLPDVQRTLAAAPLGKTADLKLRRGDKEISLSVIPREKGKVEGEELACPRWDFTVKAINQFENPDLHFYRDNGVFIFGLKHPGNAMSSGMQQQDILVKIEDRPIKTLDDVRAAHTAAIAKIATRSKVRVTVLRGGLERQFVVDFARDYSKE